jgi:hypothetical protein
VAGYAVLSVSAFVLVNSERLEFLHVLLSIIIKRLHTQIQKSLADYRLSSADFKYTALPIAIFGAKFSRFLICTGLHMNKFVGFQTNRYTFSGGKSINQWSTNYPVYLSTTS